MELYSIHNIWSSGGRRGREGMSKEGRRMQDEGEERSKDTG